MTDRCNFRCAYCYQPRGSQSLDFYTFAKAMEFFYPLMAPGCFINYYGGEPLLAFNELKRTVEFAEWLDKANAHKLRYSLTTNGSVLDDRIIEFLDEHGFSLTLSFDGLAQDISRKNGSSNLLVSAIPKILARPGIVLETNSVFGPGTVHLLSGSVRYIIQLGVKKLNINLAQEPDWTSTSLSVFIKEIDLVGDFFESRYERLQDVPWATFYEETEKAIYGCPAGLSQMALSAHGTLWGCALFPHYFMDTDKTGGFCEYCFGDVDSFVKNPEAAYAQKAANYSRLRMDRFSTPDRSCLMCDELQQCWICPLAAALATGSIGEIPIWKCQEEMMLRNERKLLLKRFKERGRPTL